MREDKNDLCKQEISVLIIKWFCSTRLEVVEATTFDCVPVEIQSASYWFCSESASHRDQTIRRSRLRYKIHWNARVRSVSWSRDCSAMLEVPLDVNQVQTGVRRDVFDCKRVPRCVGKSDAPRSATPIQITTRCSTTSRGLKKQRRRLLRSILTSSSTWHRLTQLRVFPDDAHHSITIVGKIVHNQSSSIDHV